MLTFDLQQKLMERAKSAQGDVHRRLIEALERKVQENQAIVRNKMPTRAEIDACVKQTE